MRNNGGIEMKLLGLRVMPPFLNIAGFSFYWNQGTNVVDILTPSDCRLTVRAFQVNGYGSLQRFAIEWYYENILQRSFGGRRPLEYEVKSICAYV